MSEAIKVCCSDNAFCSSLSPQIRARLCEGCRRRLIRSGSIISYSEMADRATILLDGFHINRTESEVPDAEGSGLYTPCFPGRLLYQDTLLSTHRDYEVTYITMECLTDCCIASFKYKHLQALYNENPEFARKAHESAIALMYDFSAYIGVLRAPAAQDKVKAALKLLSQWGIHLSNNNLAKLLALDRTTVSREISNIKRYSPEIYEEYVACKNHQVKMLNPA